MKLKENKIVKIITKRKIWIRQILVAAIASAFAWFLGDALVENGGLVAAIICSLSIRISLYKSVREGFGQIIGTVIGAGVALGDINKDGLLQLNEMSIGGDIIVLATAEIGGLPYVISGLVAAGGLAAALSTADGLLLTIANALSHDLYYKVLDPNASTARRVMVSKLLLLLVALAAAYVAAQKPADILFLVSAAFSFAAAAFFPALTLGIFWKRANKWGASLGMLAGLGITFYYMVTTQPWLYKLTHGTAITPEIVKANTWWDIAPISAGLFGVPLGFAVIIIVSLLTKAPGKEIQELVEHVRYPSLDGKTSAASAAH